MFRADIGVIERLCFLTGERQDLLDARRVGNVTDNFCLRPRAHLFLHFHSDGLKIEAHLLQDVYRHSLPEFDQAQEQMLGANVVVIEPVGFLASKRQNLLSPGCKIIHYSLASVEPLPDPVTILLISGLGKSFKRSRIICARN